MALAEWGLVCDVVCDWVCAAFGMPCAGNLIGPAGATSLAEAIKVSSTITSVNLGCESCPFHSVDPSCATLSLRCTVCSAAC